MEKNRKKVIIFGIGNNSIYSFMFLEKKYAIVGILDNSIEKQGKLFFGHEVQSVEDFENTEYDYIIITPSLNENIINQLVKHGISKRKILTLEQALNISYDIENPIKIAFLLYGGMGDYIIAKNWLYYLVEKYGLNRETVYLYSKEEDFKTIQSIYCDCMWINEIRIIKCDTPSLVDDAFDLIFRFSIFPYVQFMNDQKIYIRNRALYEYADAVRRFGVENYEQGFFSNPYFYKTVSRLFSLHPEKKYHTHFDILDDFEVSEDYRCDIPIIGYENYLYDLGLEPKSYITIDTGLNREYVSKSNTRAWKYEYWDKLARLIKEKYHNFKIIQIGLSDGNHENIIADLNLNGKTNLEQAKVLLKNALLHIDYEGGLIHLRHVLKGGPSIVLMGPTSERVHNYPENIAVYTNVCPASCEWQGQDWLVRCQKGYLFPKCMESITPEMVMEKVNQFMETVLKENC